MIYVVLATMYLLVLNVIATYRISKSELTEKPQKVAQTVLIWVLPLVGAVIVSMLLNQDEPIELKKKSMAKTILLFLFIVKVKTDKKQRKQNNDGVESVDDYTYTYWGASASDL